MSHQDRKASAPETIEDVTRHRPQLLTEIIRLELTMIPQQRGRVLRDEKTSYQTARGADVLTDLLRNVPLPPEQSCD